MKYMILFATCLLAAHLSFAQETPPPVPTAPPTPEAPPEVPPAPVQGVEEVFKRVEEKPHFPCDEKLATRHERTSCGEKKMFEFIKQHLRYPPIAKENIIEGMVYVKFVVEEDGRLTNVEVKRDIGGGCGEEAKRIVGLMPKWVPGMQRGRPMRVEFVLPVRFMLQ